MNVQKKTDKITNVMIVGVGGQGVIMVSKVLALLCQRHGYDVKQSEVHGMAKRGGVVFSHVRYGTKVWSPTIPEGQADVLLALEWAEALRWLKHLKAASGTFIADTQHIIPPFACLSRERGAISGYSTKTPDEIIDKVAKGYALDATGIATDLGNFKVSNTVLLGTLSTALEFSKDDWRDTIRELVPPKTIDTNLEAFQKGRDWVREAQEAPVQKKNKCTTPVPIRVKAKKDIHVDLKPVITPEWCKGCDICVKMCPEFCLRLNAEQVVEVVKPEKCTGCRICEWLCPDFAIDIVKAPVTLNEGEQVGIKEAV